MIIREENRQQIADRTYEVLSKETPHLSVTDRVFLEEEIKYMFTYGVINDAVFDLISE